MGCFTSCHGLDLLILGASDVTSSVANRLWSISHSHCGHLTAYRLLGRGYIRRLTVLDLSRS